jgi:hypothetical protein
MERQVEANPRYIGDEEEKEDREAKITEAQVKLGRLTQMRDTINTPGWQHFIAEIAMEKDQAAGNALAGRNLDIAETSFAKGEFRMAGFVLDFERTVHKRISEANEIIVEEEE